MKKPSLYEENIPPFPDILRFSSGFMEVPAESSSKYFIALKCKGFPIHNPGGQEIDIFKDEWPYITSVDLKFEITSVRNRKFFFKTMVYLEDPTNIKVKPLVV